MNILEVPFFLNVFKNNLKATPKHCQGVFECVQNKNVSQIGPLQNLGRPLCFYNMGMAAIMGG
jgi:hypothetical protein